MADKHYAENNNRGDAQQPVTEVLATEVPQVNGNGDAAFLSAASTKDNDTLGIVSLVAGISGIFCSVFFPLNIALGITALICGIKAKAQNQRFAVTGIILGVTSLVLAIIGIIVVIIALLPWILM